MSIVTDYTRYALATKHYIAEGSLGPARHSEWLMRANQGEFDDDHDADEIMARCVRELEIRHREPVHGSWGRVEEGGVSGRAPRQTRGMNDGAD